MFMFQYTNILSSFLKTVTKKIVFYYKFSLLDCMFFYEQ